ncbi:MAG TPA: hypothetical protein VJ754_06565 [Anaerolineae bacterium]|nr:hypothetical protein [Anaerolineae bacterium]
MNPEPSYIRRLLDQARAEGQWHAGQADAAALCFDVLALIPDHREAAELVYELFCDEWLIYDNRTALQQHIDEWDDRPWQQRRRLALSFRFMSRWDGWQREYEDGYEREREGPPDVADLLDKGKGQLLHAYCLGDEACTDFAWPLFAEAFRRSADPRHALYWVGKQYADLGFFADSVEVLAELCSRFNDLSARRLLAEVRWWRDNAHRLPWLPPPGDGARYKRMMAFIDPDAPGDEEVIRSLRETASDIDRIAWRPTIDPALADLIGAALPPVAAENDLVPSPVDWSFLDTDDGQPGELPEWAKKMMRLFPGQADDIARRHRWSRPIPPPQTPPRRDPAEPPFDAAEFLDMDGGVDERDDDFAGEDL